MCQNLIKCLQILYIYIIILCKRCIYIKYGLSKEIKRIINKYNVYQFRIFGSRTRGDYKNSSDIDISVLDNITEQDKFLILNEFNLINMPNIIDVVFMKNIEKKSLIDSILKEGVVFL